MSAIASKPAWALVAGASLWGIVWYPYRLLAQAGMDGIWATALTYGLALVARLHRSSSATWDRCARPRCWPC